MELTKPRIKFKYFVMFFLKKKKTRVFKKDKYLRLCIYLWVFDLFFDPVIMKQDFKLAGCGKLFEIV